MKIPKENSMRIWLIVSPLSLLSTPLLIGNFFPKFNLFFQVILQVGFLLTVWNLKYILPPLKAKRE